MLIENARLTPFSTSFCLGWRHLSAFILAAVAVTSSYSQQPAEDLQLKNLFTDYSRRDFQEKLYLHTDKDFYLAGEICWFKIYNTDAVFNRPLGVSKLAYVEILDSSNKAVLQSKVGLNGGSGNGSLQLPVTLGSGHYLLRAYTNWMKNFNAAYFFEKELTVINTHIAYVSEPGTRKDSLFAQFFPEGGNLVNGIESRIALKVINRGGSGVLCHGVVVGEQGDTVARFSTQRFGLGSFLFTASKNHRYTALLSSDGYASVQQEIPPALEEGLVMQVSNPGNQQLQVHVQSSARFAGSTVYLLAHTRGLVKQAVVEQLRNGSAIFALDQAKLGDGISHITLFDAARQPICERLFFKRPGAHLSIDVSADQPVYETQKKITIQIFSTENDGKPLPADMSMAVSRIDSLSAGDQTDISSYLWLCSDLVGNIESPAYYFSNDPGAAEAADNLMLTQGWRRFHWQDVLQGKSPSFSFVPEYRGHIIKGRVVNNNGEPVKEAESFLGVPGTQTLFRDAYSDDSGHVAFEMSNFYGNDEIVVQTNGQDAGDKHVEIETPFSSMGPANRLSPFSLPLNAADLSRQHAALQIGMVYRSDRMREVKLPVADTNTFYQKPDNAYMLDDYTRFTTVEEVLREYVPDVNVRKSGGKFQLPVFDNVRREFFKTSPLILLDGIPVLDADRIMRYDPLKIKKLEVVARMYFYGNMFFGGIVNFITYHGDLSGYELDPRATVLDYGTLQHERVFFSPVHEPGQQTDRFPDFRTLLHWSPSIKTGVSGRHEAVLYSSGIPGRYAVAVQGIAPDGRTGSKIIYIEVKDSSAMAASK